MRLLAGIAGIVILLVVLWEAFETIVLPRRVTRKFRLTRAYYRTLWRPWAALARGSHKQKRRDSFLSLFGPLSLIVLLAFWAALLIVGFALVQFAAGSGVAVSGEPPSFLLDLYFSGTTFFTLGLGDVTPHTGAARALSIIESGVGFGFLALMISYLPVLYQAFSRRELEITLLDARAGSPPTATELLRRHAAWGDTKALQEVLHDFERWAADLLESHISYPVLVYFRSQHANQSWLATLSVLLDTSVLASLTAEGSCARQARLTFAAARHVVVDLAQVFSTPPRALSKDRLSPEEFAAVRKELAGVGMFVPEGEAVEAKVRALRHQYEPYVNALANRLVLTVPPWLAHTKAPDNWQTSAWGRISGFAVAGDEEVTTRVADDHL